MTHHEFLDRLGLGPDKMPGLWEHGKVYCIACNKQAFFYYNSATDAPDSYCTCGATSLFPRPEEITCLIPDPRLPTDDRNVLLCGEFMREELSQPHVSFMHAGCRKGQWGCDHGMRWSFGPTPIQALAAACEAKWRNEG